METGTFVWKGGRSVEVDVCENDAALLRQCRRLTSGRTEPTGDTAAIREWAKAHHMEIGEKGRIPAAIVDAYNAKK